MRHRNARVSRYGAGLTSGNASHGAFHKNVKWPLRTMEILNSSSPPYAQVAWRKSIVDRTPEYQCPRLCFFHNKKPCRRLAPLSRVG